MPQPLDRTRALQLGTAVMVCAAAPWLAYQSWRLLWGGDPVWPGSPVGAVDLLLRRRELEAWASDAAFVGFYPPASYAILWPLVGWPDATLIRPIWALLSALCLWWLVSLTLDHSTATTPAERRFVAWIPVSMYATGATIGNGQLPLAVMATVMAATTLVASRPATWTRDVIAGLLFAVALVKPTLSGPFFWVLALVPGGIRPGALAALGYGVLTLIALPTERVAVVGGSVATLAASTRYALADRYADLGVLLQALGLARWAPAATAAIVLWLGWWTWRRRLGDVWPLLAVTALVSRFLAYHRWYDDLVLLLPLVALFRLASGRGARAAPSRAAAWLFTILWASLLAPGGYYLLPAPFNAVWAVLQAIVWATVLVYFLVITRLDRSAEAPAGQAAGT
jgi:hypothetical protein